MSLAYKNFVEVSKKGASPIMHSHPNLYKSYINQRIAEAETNFDTNRKALARPLRYGTHAAVFAELLKSRSGEGNLK